jgi:hypothetical protein
MPWVRANAPTAVELSASALADEPPANVFVPLENVLLPIAVELALLAKELLPIAIEFWPVAAAPSPAATASAFGPAKAATLDPLASK